MCPRVTPRINAMSGINRQKQWNSNSIHFWLVSLLPIIPLTKMKRKKKSNSPNISRHKPTNRPILRKKHIKPINQTQKRKPPNRRPTAPRAILKRRMIRHFRIRHPLRATSLVESNIHNPTTNPTDETRRIRQIDKPIENHCTITSHIQICESAEE